MEYIGRECCFRQRVEKSRLGGEVTEARQGGKNNSSLMAETILPHIPEQLQTRMRTGMQK